MSRQLRVPTNPATPHSTDAIPAYEMEKLREEYRQFCEDVKRDLDPIEAEHGGIPTFKEWFIERKSQQQKTWDFYD